MLVICAIALLLSPAHSEQQNTKFCFMGTRDLMDAAAPRFDQYPAGAEPSATVAKLDLHSNPIARTFPTVIRRQMRQGANFAGHYRVAIWGCGSSCAQFAVVDLKTGRAITPRAVESVSGGRLAADDFLPGTDSDEWGFRYKKNSRLLVLLGTLNEDDSKQGAFYYLVSGDKLQLIHKTIAASNTCQEGPD